MKRILSVATSAFLLGASTQATAQADRSVLPRPSTPFSGTIAENVLDAKPTPLQPVRAPQGAPNVLLFMSDDTGFAMASAFGGPVSTPNLERLAAQGQRYNRFHTTGICSPSRAALLTGRNHHNTGVGYLSDLSAGFPGYAGRISAETATIAQVLRLNGYSTAMFGKHHNTPGGERSAAGPFDNWPTGLGFEYFYGFPYGDTDQFSPILYRGTSRVDPAEGKGKMLDQRLVDDIIHWVHNQKAAAPDKPFLIYLAPGSTHAPHQAPPEYIARFKGEFDQGWDKVREESFRRQLAMGIVPNGTILTPRPEAILAWESLTPEQKAFAARSMEVAAAQLAFQDEQIGRVLDELERMGEAENTLVALVQGDNGAIGEVGPLGTINELRAMGRHDEDPAWLIANTDRLGGPTTYGAYSVAWAWAMNTPLRWTKQFASMLGGIRNGMILSWPGHVGKPGTVCSEFSHLIDIVPTVLEAAKLVAPDSVYGVKQKPIDGQSLVHSLAKCDAAKPRTQYFEIGGKIGLYHNGWFLSGEDGRMTWEALPPEGPRPEIRWTLYDLSRDFSQANDLSTKEPQRLQAMLALWEEQAQKNNVFPLDHRFAIARTDPSSFGQGRKRFDYWGKNISVPATGTAPFLAGRSFTLDADLVLDKAASGAIVAWGSYFGGWSLYLDEGRPAFIFARSTDPNEIVKVRSEKALPQGKVSLRLRFNVPVSGKAADVTLSSDGKEFGRVHLPSSILLPAGNGETFDIGRDLGIPVTDYATPRGEIEGDIPRISVIFD